MKTVFIVALLLTSILLLGTMEVATAQCEGDLKTYSTYYVTSEGEKGTSCAAICFDDDNGIRIAIVESLGCEDSPSGVLAAEVGDDGDFGKNKQHYVGEIYGDPCHLYVWNFKGSFFTLDCVEVDDNGFSFHVFGESSVCTCDLS
jgi:hypothetical protein